MRATPRHLGDRAKLYGQHFKTRLGRATDRWQLPLRWTRARPPPMPAMLGVKYAIPSHYGTSHLDRHARLRLVRAVTKECQVLYNSPRVIE